MRQGYTPGAPLAGPPAQAQLTFTAQEQSGEEPGPGATYDLLSLQI